MNADAPDGVDFGVASLTAKMKWEMMEPAWCALHHVIGQVCSEDIWFKHTQPHPFNQSVETMWDIPGGVGEATLAGAAVTKLEMKNSLMPATQTSLHSARIALWQPC